MRAILLANRNIKSLYDLIALTTFPRIRVSLKGTGAFLCLVLSVVIVFTDPIISTDVLVWSWARNAGAAVEVRSDVHHLRVLYAARWPGPNRLTFERRNERIDQRFKSGLEFDERLRVCWSDVTDQEPPGNFGWCLTGILHFDGTPTPYWVAGINRDALRILTIVICLYWLVRLCDGVNRLRIGGRRGFWVFPHIK